MWREMQLPVQFHTAVTVVSHLSHLPPWSVLSQAFYQLHTGCFRIVRVKWWSRKPPLGVRVLKKSQLENTHQKVSTQIQNRKLFSYEMRYKHYEEQWSRVSSKVYRFFFFSDWDKKAVLENEWKRIFFEMFLRSRLSSAVYTHGLDLGKFWVFSHGISGFRIRLKAPKLTQKILLHWWSVTITKDRLSVTPPIS